MKRSAILVASLVAVATLSLAPAASAQRPDTMRRRADSGMMRMSMMRDSADARLDSLMRTMNSATGDRKVTAMAAVINELVAERRMMHQHMRAMMQSGAMGPHPGMGQPGMMRRPATPAPATPDSAAGK